MEFSQKYFIKLCKALLAYGIKADTTTVEGGVTVYQFYKQLSKRTAVCVLTANEYCVGCHGYTGRIGGAMFWHNVPDSFINSTCGLFAHATEEQLAAIINDIANKSTLNDMLKTSIGELVVSLS